MIDLVGRNQLDDSGKMRSVTMDRFSNECGLKLIEHDEFMR
jgi:hypothetical protein